MGEKAVCAICGGPVGFFKFTGKDGMACKKCLSEANIKLQQLHFFRPYESVAEIKHVNDTDITSLTEERKKDFISELDSLAADDNEAYFEMLREKIKKNDVHIQPVDNTPKCPKCHSTSISAYQQGFGVGKSVVGAAVAGPLGLVAGNIGSKKVHITCLNCGYRWQAGKKDFLLAIVHHPVGMVDFYQIDMSKVFINLL